MRGSLMLSCTSSFLRVRAGGAAPTAPATALLAVPRRFHGMSAHPPYSRRLGRAVCSSAPLAASSGDPSSEQELQQGPWSIQERNLFWDAVPRCLLKLGKAGAQESHIRSLQDMLDVHTLVKVQLNADPVGAGQLAQQLSDECRATLVQVRGRTILLANGGTSAPDVTKHAQEELTKIKAYHLKRKNRAQGVAVERGQDMGQGYPKRFGQEGRTPRPVSTRSEQPARPGMRPVQRGSAPARPSGARPGAPNTGAPGPSIDQLIQASVVKAELSKETLQQEWTALATQIQRQEAAEFGGKRRTGPGSQSAPAAPLASRKRASKAPWKQQASG